MINLHENSYSDQLVKILKERIAGGEYLPGQKIPSERDLCSFFNISRTTARNAIHKLEESGVLVRKHGSGTFVNEQLPFEGESEHTSTKNIGFIRCELPNFSFSILKDDFWFEVFEGLQENSNIYNYHLFFTSIVEEKLKKDYSILENLLEKVDGLVIGQPTESGIINKIREYNKPMICISPRISEWHTDYIFMDNEGGAKKAVQYLIDNGHGKIGMINGPLKSKQALGRFEGYKRCLEENGLTINPAYITGNRNWDSESGFIAMKELIETNDTIPSVIFVASDALASGAIQACNQANLRIPDDISIIGFDDTKLSEHMVPALTTVHVPKREMGSFAFSRLLQRIESPGIPLINVTFSTELAERESCRQITN